MTWALQSHPNPQELLVKRLSQGAGASRGLWGCPGAPTSGQSPEQACEPRQASPVGGQAGEPQAGEGGPGQVLSTTRPLPASATPLHLPKPD